MAAVQASQPNLSNIPVATCVCGKSLEGNYLARHVCAGCGRPQPVSKSENYFSVFGVAEKFSQDLGEIQKRFYDISRTLHPDRFTTSDATSRQASLERMSLVNEAYRTLRDPVLLRDYVLTLHGLKVEGARGQIPMELAESWFELQDVMSEDPAQAGAKIAAFRKELEGYRANVEEKLKALEATLDSQDPLSSPYRSELEKLSRLIQELSYLKSLNRDVDRLGAHV